MVKNFFFFPGARCSGRPTTVTIIPLFLEGPLVADGGLRQIACATLIRFLKIETQQAGFMSFSLRGSGRQAFKGGHGWSGLFRASVQSSKQGGRRHRTADLGPGSFCQYF